MNVIFEWCLLRIIVFLVMGWSAENVEEKKKTDKSKSLKREEKEKRLIGGKSNNNNRHLWFYKLYFSRKYHLKKSCLYYQILFTVFMRCRIFETQ